MGLGDKLGGPNIAATDTCRREEDEDHGPARLGRAALLFVVVGLAAAGATAAAIAIFGTLHGYHALACAAVGLALGMLAGAPVLWRSGHRHEHTLGTGLLVGLLVAVAVGLGQLENSIDRQHQTEQDQDARDRAAKDDQKARDRAAAHEERVRKDQDLRLIFGTVQDLTGFDGRGKGLKGVYARKKTLRVSRFSHANLRDANLRRSNLYDSTMRGVDLTNADLIAVMLCGADLRGAFSDGRPTSLRNADLARANLVRVDFDKHTDLRGSRLQNANLWETRHLAAAKLNGAEWDYNTQFPAQWDRNRAKQEGMRFLARPKEKGLRPSAAHDTGCRPSPPGRTSAKRTQPTQHR